MSTKISHPSIDAEHVTVGTDCAIDPDSLICGDHVAIGRGVVIGQGVRISADRIEIADGCRIGRHASIVSPEIRIGTKSAIGADCTIELNAHLRIGKLADVGRRLRAVGQGIEAGDHLWVTDDVTIGGGGRGQRSFLTLGHRCAIMDRSFINIAEPVEIGDETALSNNTIVLTHAMWQPILDGGTAQFGPVRIGRQVIVYVNAVIAPGITIGDHVTIGAGALVVRDVPSGSMAVGNPARIVKSTPSFPRSLTAERRDALVRELLREYADGLAAKGARVSRPSADTLAVALNDSEDLIRYIAPGATGAANERPAISVAVGAVPDAAKGRVHLDLEARTMNGEPTPLAEDLRDFLRRRSIRVFTDQPFRSLALANTARLKARLLDR